MILLTGATGYVGRRLLRALSGQRVRCLARRPDAVERAGGVEVLEGDVLDPAALAKAFAGVTTAVYLVHAMADEEAFADRDRRAAEAFGRAAKAAGVRRIVYLGGLGHEPGLSAHLASRQEVGRVLAASGVPVVELRASIVLGAGSLPFELARRLIEKLPAMLMPRWVRTRAQPIAVDDVVAYLREALEADLPEGGVFEIGGAERVSYAGLMREIARQRGLRRLMLPVPMLSPGLSSRWLRLVAPREARVGRSLIEGVRNETVVRDPSAQAVFRVRPVGLAEAVRRALASTPPPEPPASGARSWLALAGFLALCLGVGGLGGLATRPAIPTWYAGLLKPSWCPPPWLFGPVWSALYAAMAVSAWRLWRRQGLVEERLPLALFALQLLLNALWSWLFFAARAPVAALVDLLLLWLVLLAATVFTFPRDRLAGWLYVPTLAWVAFAAALNASIAVLNR